MLSKLLKNTAFDQWQHLHEVLARRDFYGELNGGKHVVTWEVAYIRGEWRFILFDENYDLLVGEGVLFPHRDWTGKTPFEIDVWSVEDAIKTSSQYVLCREQGSEITYSEHLQLGGEWRHWKTRLMPVPNGPKQAWKLIGVSERIGKIESNTRKALDNSTFTFHYQPIIRVSGKCKDCLLSPDLNSCMNDCVAGYEALARFPDVDYPLHVVLQVVADIDRMTEITRKAAMDAAEKLATLPQLEGKWVSINVASCDFIPEIARATHQFAIEPMRLAIEITEDAEIDDELIGRIKTARLLGHNVEVDDYGKPRASLERLLGVGLFSIIKIDRVFIQGIDGDHRKQSIVRNTVDLCRELNIEVACEGVETREEMATVIELGIHYVQGYYTGRPAPLQ